MDRINQWLTLVANLGVVAGIVFLAIEIQQNTAMMKAQTRDSMTEKQMLISEWMISNEHVTRINMLGSQDQLEPGTFEWNTYLFLLNGIFREWENSFYQYESGLYDETEFQPRRARWVNNMRIAGYRRMWGVLAFHHSERFQAEMARIIAETDEEELAELP